MQPPLKAISRPISQTLNHPPAENAGLIERAPKADENKTAVPKGSSSIRVDTSKIDTLINMVGELVITQSMLSLIGEHFELDKLDHLKNGLSELKGTLGNCRKA